jgi:hypothetical protein
MDKKSTPEIQIAKIGARQAIIVAIISAVITLSSLVTKEIIAPSFNKADVQQEIKKTSPQWKLFDELRTDKITSQSLGDWQVCTLVTTGTIHANQACICELSDTDPTEAFNWQLRVDLDENVRGAECICRAACFNF